ncbi:MAG: TauD/TfdA family dioxygenase [Planctomycetota bacterium]
MPPTNPPRETHRSGPQVGGRLTGKLLELFGLQLQGVQLNSLDETSIEQLRGLLAHHGVVVARQQEANDADFASFLVRLGPAMFTVGETPVDGYPTLNVVTNVGRTTRPRSVYHTDTSYVSRPPAFTALRAVDVPDRGGETLFVNQYEALARLPNKLLKSLKDARVLHRASGLPDGVESRNSWHPLVRFIRESGREALFLSTPKRCIALSGMPSRLSRSLLRLLYKHSTEDGQVYRHQWKPGDIVIWDNRCTLHRADHSEVEGHRTLHRGMVRGESPRVSPITTIR